VEVLHLNQVYLLIYCFVFGVDAEMDTPPSGIICAKLEVRCFYSTNKQRGVHHEE
jgi:hypothetical protein